MGIMGSTEASVSGKKRALVSLGGSDVGCVIAAEVVSQLPHPG